jgi:hypothetical protein
MQGLMPARPTRRLFTLLAVVISAVHSASLAFANPVGQATVDALNELPFAVAQGTASHAQEARLVSLWGIYGLDQPGLYYRKTREIIDSSFDQLKKCMLDSQAQGYGLDSGIQARFRRFGTESDWRAMRAQVRAWLVAPDSTLARSVRIISPPEAVTRGVDRQRERAAGMLADWGDSVSLVALLGEAHLSKAAYGALEGSLDRLRNTFKYEFIAPDGRGGIRFNRTRSELVSMTFRRAHGSDCPDTLRGRRVDELWGLLHRAREGKHASWFNDGASLRLAFKDGLVADLKPTESGWIEYSDSIQGEFIGRVVMEAPELFEAVKECLPERKLPEWPHH